MPEYIDKIIAAADWQQSDTAICDALNTPSIANPTAQGNVPRQLVKNEALALIDPGHVAALLNYVNLDLVYISFDAQDHESAINWTRALAAAGIIDAADATAVITFITEQVPDPEWQEQVSWAQVNLGRPVTCEDIHNAREIYNAGN